MLQYKINQTVNKQIEFQKTMNSNSQTMYLALVEELGECVASMGYSDWKKVERDEDNIKIELVDIAVFAMNLAYYNDSISIPNTIDIDDEFTLIQLIIKALAAERYSVIYHYIFWYDESLVDILIAKQALNKLRQAYGYKTGEYIKDWQGREDNEYLKQFYGLSYKEVYDKMEEFYIKVVEGTLVNVFD